MQNQLYDKIQVLRERSSRDISSLRSRADDLLLAVAVLGLVASISDGEADSREIDIFTKGYRRQYALSRSSALKLICLALRKIREAPADEVVDAVCDTLNQHLTMAQKLAVFDNLADILVADGKVRSGEQHFLSLIALKLGLAEALRKKVKEPRKAKRKSMN